MQKVRNTNCCYWTRPTWNPGAKQACLFDQNSQAIPKKPGVPQAGSMTYCLPTGARFLTRNLNLSIWLHNRWHTPLLFQNPGCPLVLMIPRSCCPTPSSFVNVYTYRLTPIPTRRMYQKSNNSHFWWLRARWILSGNKYVLVVVYRSHRCSVEDDVLLLNALNTISEAPYASDFKAPDVDYIIIIPWDNFIAKPVSGIRGDKLSLLKRPR